MAEKDVVEKDLSSLVVVITGASSGFGRGAALKFAQAGASVVLAARQGRLLDELVRECLAAGGAALAVPTDVGKEAEVAALAAAAVRHFGRMDVWVNNAGAAALGLFEEVPIADHVRVIETDLLGTLYGSHVAIKQFKEQGKGVLINISSVMGKVPAPYCASYTAAKHGIVGLTLCLRQELEEDKADSIHVCLVEPSSFDTPFFEHAATHTGRKAVPIPPVYDPQEVADAIVGLVRQPKREIQVGASGAAIALLHQFAPSLAEKTLSRMTRAAQIDKAPPAPDTEGDLHRPSSSGTGGGFSAETSE